MALISVIGRTWRVQISCAVGSDYCRFFARRLPRRLLTRLTVLPLLPSFPFLERCLPVRSRWQRPSCGNWESNSSPMSRSRKAKFLRVLTVELNRDHQCQIAELHLHRLVHRAEILATRDDRSDNGAIAGNCSLLAEFADDKHRQQLRLKRCLRLLQNICSPASGPLSN